MITAGAWWRTKGGKFPLTAVHSGSAAVEAYIYGDKLFCDFVDLGTSETITITIPFKLKIVTALMRIASGGNQATKTLTISNGSDAVSNAMSMATDKAIVAPSTIDSAYCSVAKAGTIVFTSSAHSDADALVVIDIIPD